MVTSDSRILERALAVASFVVATALAFTSLLIGEDNTIASNVLFVIAQFLLFSATLLGFDYKWNGSQIFKTTTGASKQQPPQP